MEAPGGKPSSGGFTCAGGGQRTRTTTALAEDGEGDSWKPAFPANLVYPPKGPCLIKAQVWKITRLTQGR
ncbi:hypothetical protein L1987_57659 [Smallanthus sonchifolius]|uniref:Uncharacterized protein n=1 Tax=Smallanthus sonchifolius TaxID=185202 RepID=A0ACB9DDL7_9ASTR|nr:hypothetical protein L1987_57659 [Smallanthus sonchifolius]